MKTHSELTDQIMTAGMNAYQSSDENSVTLNPAFNEENKKAWLKEYDTFTGLERFLFFKGLGIVISKRYGFTSEDVKWLNETFQPKEYDEGTFITTVGFETTTASDFPWPSLDS